MLPSQYVAIIEICEAPILCIIPPTSNACVLYDIICKV